MIRRETLVSNTSAAIRYEWRSSIDDHFKYIINHNIEEGNYPNDTISLIFLIEILLLTHRMPCELNRYQTLIRRNYIFPMLLLINEK